MKNKFIVIVISFFAFINCKTTNYKTRFLSPYLTYNSAISSKQVKKNKIYTKLHLENSIPVKAEIYKKGKIIGKAKFNKSGKITYVNVNQQNGNSKYYYYYKNNKLNSMETFIDGAKFVSVNYSYKNGILSKIKVSNIKQKVEITMTFKYSKDFFLKEFRYKSYKDIITEKTYLKKRLTEDNKIYYDASTINNLIPHIFKNHTTKKKELFFNGKLTKKKYHELLSEILKK